MFQFDIDTAEIFIYDDIGPSMFGMIDFETVDQALSELSGRRVLVRLNTPGGSVDEGIAIYNALRRHPGGVDTVVDSLAASMGSYLMQAGETRTVTSNAVVMVHNPMSLAFGNAEQFRKQADKLDTYRSRMIPDYSERSGLSVPELTKMLDDETWLTGAEAVERGFADSVEGETAEPVKIAAGRFQKTPAALLMRRKAGSRTKYPLRREAAKIRTRLATQ